MLSESRESLRFGQTRTVGNSSAWTGIGNGSYNTHSMANLRSILLLLLVAFLALALISSASAQRNRNNKNNNKNKGQQQQQQQRPVANKRPKPQQNPNRPNKPVQNTPSPKVFTTTLSGLGKIRGRTTLTEWTGQTVMQFLDVPYGKAERFKVRSPLESIVPMGIKALLFATVC